MKKKLLLALSVIILATGTNAFAKTHANADLVNAINLYKAGNYSECYIKLNQYLEKDDTNALAYYYMAMTNAQMGDSDSAVSNYDKAIGLASPNSNLSKYAIKGKRCLESPTECSDSLYSSAEEEFIRNLKGAPYTKEVKSEFERLRIENMMREMNRSNDIAPQEFKEFKDFSTMNLQDTPSNDEIVAALRTLQKAGLTAGYNNPDLALLTGNPQQSQLMNMLGGSSMNSQLIQSLLTNNMSLGF